MLFLTHRQPLNSKCKWIFVASICVFISWSTQRTAILRKFAQIETLASRQKGLPMLLREACWVERHDCVITFFSKKLIIPLSEILSCTTVLYAKSEIYIALFLRTNGHRLSFCLEIFNNFNLLFYWNNALNYQISLTSTNLNNFKSFCGHPDLYKRLLDPQVVSRPSSRE